MDIAVCVAPERAFDPGLRAHVSGVWANQKYKIETPNCLVIFKRQIRKTLLTGWGTDVSPPTSLLSGAPLPMGTCRQRWWWFGERVSELYGSCLARGQVCLSVQAPAPVQS